MPSPFFSDTLLRGRRLSSVASPEEGIIDNQELVNEVESETFDHYVSPCEFRVSNDPEVGECDATIYGCARDHAFLPGGREQVREMSLEFDYDVHYRADDGMYDLPDLLEFLEGAMLEHMAAMLGLQHCEATTTNINVSSGSDRRGRGVSRRRRLEASLDRVKEAVVAIGSDPRDLPVNVECPGEVVPGTACQPMIGFMTAYIEQARVEPDDMAVVTSKLLEAVSLGMKQDVYAKGAVRKVEYIGQRLIVPSTSSVQEGEKSGGSESFGLGPLEISLMTVAAAILLLLMLLVASRRRRKEPPLSSCGSVYSTPEHSVGDAEAYLDDDEPIHSRKNYAIHHSPKSKAPHFDRDDEEPLEGSEIPGSLAAKDALALKAQSRIERLVDGTSSTPPSTPPRNVGDKAPSTPQTVPNTPVNNSSASSDRDYAPSSHPAHLVAETPVKNRSTNDVPDATTSPVHDIAETEKPQRLSPVQNPKTGVSPSLVSPRRNSRQYSPIEPRRSL